MISLIRISRILLALALAFVSHLRTRGEDTRQVARAPAGVIRRSFLVALPALTLPFVVRFVVTEGVATATEVSTIGIAYTVLLGVFVYRQFEWRRLYGLMVEAASLSGAILFIIGAASGPIADRIGARAMALTGSLIIGLGLFVAAQAQALWEVYLGFGLGIGIAILIVVFGPWVGLLAAGFHTALYLLLNAAVNAVTHTFGRRPYDNTATNLQWLALLTMGEGLHNNHHAAPTSAKLAFRRGELDPAWPAIALATRMRLMTIRHEDVKLKQPVAA